MNVIADGRIFVGIASYRDPDCVNTLASLFSKARHPRRVFVGLCWQAIAGQDDDRYPVITNVDQCRVIQVDARESKGVCWARSKVQSLWGGEEYILQIDSHMRFVDGWDETLLEMLAKCDSEKPVLSSYPPAFTPPDRLVSNLVTTMHATRFDANGILGLDSIGVEPDMAPEILVSNPFCAAGFVFADSRIIQEVPYDPYIYFQGEEITLSVRLWTNGWDVFSPNRVVAYHDYDNHPGRERHWNDHKYWLEIDQISQIRVRHLLGMEQATHLGAMIDIEKFGLGNKRSLADYEKFSGINFKERTIAGRTEEQIEETSSNDVKRKRHSQFFSSIWQNNIWGKGEMRSGVGSTLDSTALLRPKLRELLDFLKIESLVDVGCGECNWIEEITHSLKFYFGIDIVEELLVEMRRKFLDRPECFFVNRDIIIDQLPGADGLLVRDVLTHFPDYAVKSAIRNIRQSCAGYLIATHHPSGNNDKIQLGGWRAINLCAAPFGLPVPRIFVSEDNSPDGKGLGVWQISALPEVGNN